MPEINLNSAFKEAIDTLNPKQLEAVNTIEGPVMVVAGPGTGKTQILAARIGKILVDTQLGPENILCLTFTEAGTVAMRKRLIKFIGPEAYKVDIHTFHSFANKVIQDNMHLFGARQLEPITDLEAIDFMKVLINKFPKDHVLKRWTGEIDYERKPLRNLFQEMKKENWTVAEIHKAIDEELENFKDDPANAYGRKYTNKKTGEVFQKGDLNTGKLKKLEQKMNKLRAAVDEFPNYQALMQERARYDYADMILWVLEKFNDENNTDLLSSYQEKYQYILVDEYQDTNGSQNDLLKKLIDFWDEPNVFVVGDDDQSIYKFQGANVDNIKAFANSYKSIKTIELDQNYRSTQAILDLSKALIENNDERLVNDIEGLSKNLKSSAEERIKSKLLPELRVYKNSAHQTAHIATEIEAMHEAGKDLSEVAVIYRNHAQAEDLMRYFEFKDIPYTNRRKGNVLDSSIIDNLVSTLIYIADESKVPHSREDLLFEIMHYNWYGIDSLELANFAYSIRKNYKLKWRTAIAAYGEKKSSGPDLFAQHPEEYEHAIYKMSKHVEEWIKASSNTTLQALVETIIAQSGMLKWILDNPKKVEYMQELKAFFNFIKSESKKNPTIKLKEFLRLLDLHKSNNLSINSSKIVSDINGVTLTTAHSSKGLEWKRVYIIDCTKNSWNGKGNNSGRYSMPKTLIPGDDGSGVEEQRRLFYVAMTRAKEELFISHPLENNEGKELLPSVFYAEVREAIEEVGVKQTVVEVDDETITYFHMNILDEVPIPPMERIEKQLIDRALEKYTLSVTNLNSYLKCPRNFYFSVILGVPAAANQNMAFGTAVHNALEKLFKDMIDNNSVFATIDDLKRDFENQMRGLRSSFTEEQYKNKMEYGHKILPEYYERYVNEWNKVISVEKNLEAVVEDVPIKGKLDKLEFDGNDVNVVDYKTGQHAKSKERRSFSPKKPDDEIESDGLSQKISIAHAEKYGGDYWRQAVFYKILVDEDPRKQWKVVSAEFDFVEPDSKTGEFTKEKINLDDSAVRIVRSQIKEVWTRIQNHDFEGECNDEYCRWCGFVRNHYKDTADMNDPDQELEPASLPGEELAE